MTIRISPEGRNALRRAITNHPRWDDLRKARNLSLATMGKDDYLSVAENLKIDVRAVVDAANSASGGNAKVDEAREVFETVKLPEGISTTARTAGEAFDRQAQEIVRKANDATTAYPKPTSGIDYMSPDKQEAAREYAEREAAQAVKANGHDKSQKQTDAIFGSGHGDPDKARQLFALLAEMTASKVDPDQVREIVQGEIAKALATAIPTTRIELHRAGVKVGEIGGHKHPKFATLLRAATARDANGYVPNIWLSGPAGSGKTFGAAMTAKALELAFHYNGAIAMQHELLGFVDANGSYHRTSFREAYEHGGVYLFDEVDGSDNAALLALNAALANGTATFPDGQITRHKDCIIIAAANTWGFGGTADYVGRSKIDAAFLDRFTVRISWGYDEELERYICGDEAFACRVQRARAKAKAAGLKVMITPRASISGAALIAAGFTMQEAAECTYLAALTDEQKRQVEGH